MGQDDDKAAINALLAASGVKVSATEARTVANVVVRIRAAAAAALSSLPFDLPIERFYGLLDGDAPHEDRE
jgi:hypothetical protein